MWPESRLSIGSCDDRGSENQISIDHAAKTTPAAIAAFALLELEGRDVRSLLLLERKMLLEDMLDRSSEPDGREY